MQGPFLRKYGVETTILFSLYELDGSDLQAAAAHASGDTKIMKNEAAEANTANAFTDEGQTYSIVLTAAEMEAARIAVIVVDQTSPKAWLDTVIVIETYGNASAQHAFDLGTASTPQTGDNYARLGAPAGASVSADIAAIETQTDDIGAAGAGLTAIPWNAAWDAEAQSEVADALAAYDPPTNAEMEARTLAAASYATAAALDAVDNFLDTEIAAILEDTGTTLPATLTTIDGKLDTIDNFLDTEIDAIKAVTDNLATAIELDGAVYRLTANALEQAPSGGLDAAGVRAAIGMAAADLDDQLAAIGNQAGSGAISWTVTVQDGSAIAIADADVWVTSTNDIDDAVIASGKTNGSGQVTFYLNAGTYYVWAQKAGVNITNPTEITVS